MNVLLFKYMSGGVPTGSKNMRIRKIKACIMLSVCYGDLL
jgi:hypothetical protein